MTTIIQATPEDKSRWDEYVSKHTQASPYHRFSWLESVEQAYHHQTIAWLALDENNNLIGVLPAIKITPPFGKAKLSALPFCDLGGVLADSDAIEQLLINHANNFCKSQEIVVFEHRKSGQQDETIDIHALAKVRMLLALPENSEQLFSNFKSKLRSQIRKAEKNGLTSSTGRDQKHLDGFYQVFARNMRDLGSPVHSKEWFEQVIKNYGNNAIIANVYKDEAVIGAGIVLFNGEKCSIPWASTNSDFNRLAPNMQLYWTLLAYACDNGAKEFDFGRSTPNEGTYKFKKQWGAEPFPLQWQMYKNGQLMTESSKTSSSGNARQLIENIWKKLPVNISIAIGPKIRKYISL